jgi:hypothetical protein
MFIGPLVAACIAAIYFAGAIYWQYPEASIVIVALAAGFLGILYGFLIKAVTGQLDDDNDDTNYGDFE